MLVQDAIATAVLPNPGRSSEQRTMGVGAQGSMQYGAGANAASTARLLFLRAEPAALLKASLITSMTDPTMVVSWLGAAYSLSEFANLMAVTGQVNRLMTFGQSIVSWDSEAPPFENRQSALQYLRHTVDADIAAAERTASKQEEDARRSQQAQPKYSEPYPAKGRGKGGSSSSTTGTSPAQAEAARSMARMDVAGTRNGVDAGTRTTPATAGLSSDYALSFLQLSQQSSPLYEGCITRLDFENPNHCEAFAFLTSPAQAEAVAVHLIHTHHAISNE